MSGFQVFISYAHEDSVSAQRLYKDLKNAGLNPWLDNRSLLPGQRWESKIREAMGSSRYFIALLSRNSVEKKGYVQKELDAALDVLDEIHKSDVYVIPVRLDDTVINDKKLGRIQFVDLFPDWNYGVENVIKAIKSGAAPLTASTKHAMRAAQIGLGVLVIISAIVIFSSNTNFVANLWIPAALIGVERIINGTFSAGKGRRFPLVLGILILALSMISLAAMNLSIPAFALDISGFAITIDGVGRIYFGKVNKTTNRRPRMFSIIIGTLEILMFLVLVLIPFNQSPSYSQVAELLRTTNTVSLITLVMVGVQMIVAGAAGRRLTIAR